MNIVLLSSSIVGTKTNTAMRTVETIFREKYPEEEITYLDLKELTVAFSDGRNYLDYSGDTLTVTTALMAADLIVIGSPTFQASIPATLKNIFDLLPQKAFFNKTIAAVMTAGSPKHYLVAETQLKPIIHYMKGNMLPSYVFIEEQSFYQHTIVDDDVLFRLQTLVEDAMVLAETYQTMRQKLEDSYDF